jgi:hypothetical protein
MGKNTKFYYNTRYILPIMIGIIVGFAFSLFCTPLYDCDNPLSLDPSESNFGFSRLKFYVRSPEERHKLDLLEQEHQKHIDEFEPRINLQGKPKKPSKENQKIYRPRYASEELNIKYKLFIGILSTSKTLTPYAAFYNQTMNKYTKKLTFFANNAQMNEKLLLETTPSGINVVNFNDDRDYLLPFHSIKYVIDNYIDNFDWFFFVTDKTYVRAPQVKHSETYYIILNLNEKKL